MTMGPTGSITFPHQPEAAGLTKCQSHLKTQLKSSSTGNTSQGILQKQSPNLQDTAYELNQTSTCCQLPNRKNTGFQEQRGRCRSIPCITPNDPLRGFFFLSLQILVLQDQKSWFSKGGRLLPRHTARVLLSYKFQLTIRLLWTPMARNKQLRMGINMLAGVTELTREDCSYNVCQKKVVWAEVRSSPGVFCHAPSLNCNHQWTYAIIPK